MYKIIWRVVVAVAAILFAGVLTLQLPQVQTFIAGRVTEALSEKLDGDIVFEKLYIRPFTTLVLKNVAIIDREPTSNPHDSTATPVDTLFRAQYIIARFTLEGLMRKDCLHLNKAYISNAQMNLVLEDDSPLFTQSLSRIFNIPRKEVPEVSDKDIFCIKDVEISDDAFKPIEAIISSMTPAERSNPSLLNGSRKNRIAKGSGTSIVEVNRFLKQFEQTSKMMKKMQQMQGLRRR